MRFIKVVVLVALLAGVFAGAASALDFNDESEEAPIGEVGKVYDFKLLSHGGCFYAPYRVCRRVGSAGARTEGQQLQQPDGSRQRRSDRGRCLQRLDRAQGHLWQQRRAAVHVRDLGAQMGNRHRLAEAGDGRRRLLVPAPGPGHHLECDLRGDQRFATRPESRSRRVG